MIVCLEEQKEALMKAITAKYGVSTEERGIFFSMKVDETIGFSFDPIPFPVTKEE